MTQHRVAQAHQRGVGIIDLTGKQFGRLTVQRLAGRKHRSGLWRCLCQCGASIDVSSANLRRGSTKSCGCWAKEVSSRVHRAHGHAGHTGAGNSRTYNAWHGMWQRCRNPSHQAYANYGGRGVTVDVSWQAFGRFLADMGEAPAGLTLDRRDNDGPYCKDNCRWANEATQRRNTRRNVWLTLDGVTKVVRDWSNDLEIPYNTIRNRLLRGWSVRDALTKRSRHAA
jgi:hypothetical protein